MECYSKFSNAMLLIAKDQEAEIGRRSASDQEAEGKDTNTLPLVV